MEMEWGLQWKTFNIAVPWARCSVKFAVFDPVHSWKYSIEAQKWEHLAEAEIASHFQECNTTESEAPELRPDSVSQVSVGHIPSGLPSFNT